MILYKKDTNGNIRQLEIEARNMGVLKQLSGIVGGKLVEHIKICSSKNIGKANETSPGEQALIERDALIKKKLREGYFKTIEEAESEKVILPMLAKSYDKEKKKIDWSKGVIVQPKLDGMRCLAFVKDGEVVLMSRKGVEITTMPHIVESLSKLKGEHIIDGELYAHGISFQENMKLIKKYREGESEAVMFHWYDIVSDERYIKRAFGDIRNRLKYIDNLHAVEMTQVWSEPEMFEIHSINIDNGYEGSMIRIDEKGYKVNGRCDQLLKVKDFIDETYEVLDIVPMDVYSDQGMVVCDGFKATPKMSHEDKRDLLLNKDKYIGLTAEIRFFEYTDDGLPRFPICYGFRLDK